VGEYQGFDEDKAIWKYCRDHWLCLFPKLPSRSTFVRQGANLWQYKQRLRERLAHRLGAFCDEVHLVDGFPISLCCLTYARRCRSFRSVASYGYCAAKDEKFWGFRGHLLVSSDGAIAGFSLTAANGDEREALWDMLAQVKGLLIGDKGYISEFLRQELTG